MTNAERAQAIYELWSRGDFAATDWAHEDIEVHETGPGRHSTGIDAMRTMWRDFLSAWEDFRVEAERFVARGNSVLVLTRFGGRGKTSGLPAEMQQGASRLDFRDGKVWRMVLYTSQQEALDGFVDAALEGAWNLVEWTASSDAEVLHPAGPDATGRLLYSNDGSMSAFLARGDGYTDALAYCGSWELRGDEVVHHVAGSTRRGFVGADLVRSVSWEGSDLVLTTPPRDGWVNVLRWRRAGA